MPGFILNDGAVVPPSVYSAMNTVLNKKLGTSQVYPPRDWAAIVKDLVPLPIKTASGAIASFSDGADTVPLKSLTYRFPPTQAGTGDPSPSNPRAINSVSSLGLVHTGKNLFTTEGAETTSFLKSDGTITTGSGANGWNLSDYIEVKEGVTYYFNPNTTAGTTAKAGYFDASKNFVSAINSGAISFTVPSGIKYMRFSYRSTSTDIQLELGSTPTTYEPYTSTTHTVDLGGVYGGEGNEAGEFTSTYKLETIDGDMVTSVGENGGHKYARVVMSEFSTGRNVDCLCDRYKPQTAAGDLVITWVSSTQKVVWIYDDTFTDLATAQASLNNNPVNYCYPLATPTTLAVDPVAISSRYGANNIFADVGGSEIEAEYRADIDLLISSLSNNRGLMMATPPEPEEQTENEQSEIEEENER